MTDDLIVYKRTDVAGVLYGVPDRDLTHADLARIPTLLRDVKASDLYAAVGSDEVLDPLGELDNAAFSKLMPAEKGARTREAKKRADEAETARLEAEALAAAQAHAAGDTGPEDGD